MKKEKAHKLVSSQHSGGQWDSDEYLFDSWDPNYHSTYAEYKSSRRDKMCQNHRNSQCVSLNPPRHIYREEDVRVAIEEEARKWGLQASTDKLHKSFVKLATEEALQCYRGNAIQWSPPDTSIKVPSTFPDALSCLLKVVLQKRTNGGMRLTFTRTNDLVEKEFDVSIPYPPFTLLRDRTLALNGSYKQLHAEGIESYLDPLKRFSYYTEDAKVAINADWRERQNHIAEAVAIHDIIHGGHPCTHCEAKNGFELNSNLRTSFSDVVCKSCGSIYTFWASASERSILKNLQRGTVNKGRLFGDYIQEKKNLRMGSQMYVLFVSMEDMADAKSFKTSKSGTTLPVYAARLTGVMPIFNSKSFNIDKVRIYSNVNVAPVLGSKPWFNAPLPPALNSDYMLKAVSLNAIDGYFSGLFGVLTVHDLEQSSKDVTKPDGVYKRTSEDLRAKVRTLRRKRNKIEAIKKRVHNGESIGQEETDMLQEEESVLGQLERFEKLLHPEF